MATPDIQTGTDGKVYVKPDGWSGFLELDVTDWKLSIKSNNRDVSGTKSGRTRIPGLADADGSLTMFYDDANPQMDSTTNTGANLRHGQRIFVDLVPDGSASGGTSGYRGMMIVDEVSPSVEYQGDNHYDVTFSLAVGSTLKYPGDA